MASDSPMTAAGVARTIAAMLRAMEPGDLAAVRRMEQGGGPSFWRLAARHPDIAQRPDEWHAIMRIMAILTPKGRPEDRPEVDRSKPLPLGKALCDNGNPEWKPRSLTEPEGVVSEKRLARFLALRGPARLVALERLARMLARDLPPTSQIEPASLAFAVLNPNDPKNHIGRDYYARLDASLAKKDAENG